MAVQPNISTDVVDGNRQLTLVDLPLGKSRVLKV